MPQSHEKSYTVGPLGAVATVPAEFLSSAIFGLVEGLCRAAGGLGRLLRGRRGH